MKKCSFCGAELKDDSLFCTECGKELPMGIVCPHCGASVNEGDIFCTECGKRIDEVPQVTSSEPTKPKCPHCGALINEGDVFCMECGKKIDGAQTEKTDEVFVTKECPHCGATIREDAHFCPNCDKYVEDAPAESTTEVYEPIKKECPHCGALVDENDVRCEKCGKFLMEGVEDEYEEKTFKDYLPFIFATIVVFLLIGGAWWYWDSSNQRAEREKAIADSLEVVRQDSIHKADSLKNIELQEAEKEQQIASCKAFLEKFYNGLDKAVDKNEYIRKHVTHKAQEFLRKEYDYYSESDSMAIWIFSTDLIGPMNRTIEVVDDNTYKVITTGEDYEKEVVIGIIKEGNFYKIDTIEEGNYIDSRK